MRAELGFLAAAMCASVAPAPLCPAMLMRETVGAVATTFPFASLQRFSVWSRDTICPT